MVLNRILTTKELGAIIN